jgi:hypothetical protein
VSDDVAIVRVDSSRLDDLEQPYRALHSHHTEIVPRLTVLARNDDAIRFYERAGLETVMVTMQAPTEPG